MGKCGQLAMGQCGQLGRSGAGREHDNGKLVVVLKEELEKLRKELEMERGSRGLSGVTGKERREVNHFIALCLLRGRPVCVCLLLQYLLQSCSRGGRGIVEDMCYERRRAEALAPQSPTRSFLSETDPQTPWYKWRAGIIPSRYSPDLLGGKGA